MIRRAWIRMLLSAVFVVLAVSTKYGLAAPLTIRSTTQSEGQGYLQRFGYLQKSDSDNGYIITQDHLSEAISKFQAFANLPVTGILDADTKRMMSVPRCGVPDIIEDAVPAANGQNHQRKKRYILHGSKWHVKDLTWSVSQSTSQLSQNDVETQLARALKIWSDHSDLTFTKSNGGNVDIDVRFTTFEHGDGESFDGPGYTLAHAFFPQFGGDAHFDDAEAWTLGSDGTNLYQLAAHEFGHSLGLMHSNVYYSLMTPFYPGYNENLALDSDDIAAIQDIYGPPRTAG